MPTIDGKLSKSKTPKIYDYVPAGSKMSSALHVVCTPIMLHFCTLSLEYNVINCSLAVHHSYRRQRHNQATEMSGRVSHKIAFQFSATHYN